MQNRNQWLWFQAVKTERKLGSFLEIQHLCAFLCLLELQSLLKESLGESPPAASSCVKHIGLSQALSRTEVLWSWCAINFSTS